MGYPLAIFAPFLSARTETFIRRHCQELLPGQTVTVGRVVPASQGGDWENCGPSLDLRPLHRQVLMRADGLLSGIPLLGRFSRLNPIGRFLAGHGVQLIMGEHLAASLPLLEIAQTLSVPFFGHAHGYDVSARLRLPHWRQAYLRYNQAAGVITMSQFSRKRLLEVGLAPDKVHVIPYGVDVPDRPWSRVEGKIVRCIAVGRFVAKKAPLSTLDAFRRAARVCPVLRLVYVGDGELWKAAVKFVHKHGLEAKVTLCGSQPNEVVQQMLRAADIFVQHSVTDPETGDQEGLPVAILEAMAHALPVVSTRHAGIPEQVSEGVTGYLVEEGDSVAMAERIVVLARSTSLCRQLGHAGWVRARELFSWERERRDLLAILGLADSQAAGPSIRPRSGGVLSIPT